jgi:hypothetical protein
VGLLSAIVLLPLAPVRGTVRIAELLAAEAERELGDDATIRRRLAEAEIDYDLGRLDREEYEALEDVLLLRLEELHDLSEEPA